MYTVSAAEAPAQAVQEEGAVGVRIQWLIDSTHGAPNFALRRFVLEPNGYTPWHQHPWEHEVYILRGLGVLLTEEGETPIEADQAVLVLPDEWHSFRAGEQGLEMLCLVPLGEATKGH